MKQNEMYFTNTVKVEWPEDESRNMVLLESVSFVDSLGVEWSAYEGDVIDGASIPRFLWRAIGSPFVGRYRRASVIHDVYCRSRSRPFRAVHKMFSDAMECDGVPLTKRIVMAKAVMDFGPRWDDDGSNLVVVPSEELIDVKEFTY